MIMRILLDSVRFGSFPCPVPAGSGIKRFGSLWFGSVRFLAPSCKTASRLSLVDPQRSSCARQQTNNIQLSLSLSLSLCLCTYIYIYTHYMIMINKAIKKLSNKRTSDKRNMTATTPTKRSSCARQQHISI